MDRGRRLRRHALDDRRREVDAGERHHALAELLAQMTRAYLVDLAFGQIAKLEWSERHPDQPVDREPEMAKHVLDLAVLALAHREHEPHIGALLALRQRLAIDADGVFRRDVEGRRANHRAIDRDAPGRDEDLGLTA